jgi:hypothetical protein
MPGWLGTLLPVVTLVLGAVLAQIADRGRDARQQAAARMMRDAERQQEHRRRREAFELQHLTDLHGALSALLRAIGRVHHADSLTHRETGAYAGRLLPDDVSAEHFEASRNAVALTELVLDERVRDLANAALRQADEFAGLTGGTPEAAARLVTRAADAIVEARAAVAGRIREIYVDGG